MIKLHLTWDSRDVMIPIGPATAVVGVLWAAAIGLLVYDATVDPMGVVGRWGLLIALVAGVASVTLLLRYHRRVILEVMSWEHKRMPHAHDDDEDDDGEGKVHRFPPRPRPPSDDLDPGRVEPEP